MGTAMAQRKTFKGRCRTYMVVPAIPVGDGDFEVVDQMGHRTEATIVAFDNDDPDSARFILEGVTDWDEAEDIAMDMVYKTNQLWKKTQ